MQKSLVAIEPKLTHAGPLILAPFPGKWPTRMRIVMQFGTQPATPFYLGRPSPSAFNKIKNAVKKGGVIVNAYEFDRKNILWVHTGITSWHSAMDFYMPFFVRDVIPRSRGFLFGSTRRYLKRLVPTPQSLNKPFRFYSTTRKMRVADIVWFKEKLKHKFQEQNALKRT